MRLVMAVSADGFVARGPDDDMTWTGPADKFVFKLLTLSSDSPLYAGGRTYDQMPPLKGRRLVRLSRGLDGAKLHEAWLDPLAWLIGGPEVAEQALAAGMVDRAFICRVPAVLGHGLSFESLGRHMPDEPEQVLRLDGVEILVFTEGQKWPVR